MDQAVSDLKGQGVVARPNENMEEECVDEEDFGSQAAQRVQARWQAEDEEDGQEEGSAALPCTGAGAAEEPGGGCFLALLPSPSGLLGVARYDEEESVLEVMHLPQDHDGEACRILFLQLQPQVRTASARSKKSAATYLEDMSAGYCGACTLGLHDFRFQPRHDEEKGGRDRLLTCEGVFLPEWPPPPDRSGWRGPILLVRLISFGFSI